MSQNNTNNKFLNRIKKLNGEGLNFPDNWNVFPISRNSKIASTSWKKYQKEKYPKVKLHKDNGNYAVICGEISSNLLILDLDLKDKKFFEIIYGKLIKSFPEIAKTLIVETPHGFHLYYSMKGFSETSKNRKNACYNDKLVFSGQTKTKFKECLKGFDCKGEGGYAIIPPSRINSLYYKYHNKENLKQITIEDYLKINEFFLLEKPLNLRKPFKDILNGKIEIEDQANKTGIEEFLYWKFLFREVYNVCGLTPEELFKGLEKNQPNFNIEETEKQLQYHPYTDKPITNSKLKDLFPDYYTQTKTKQSYTSPKISDKKVNNPIVVEEEALEEIDGKTDSEKFGEIFVEIDFNNCFIEVREYGLYKAITKYNKAKKEYYIVRELILDGKLEIIKKTNDIAVDNKELFTFYFRDKTYHTLPLPEILRLLDPYTYKGSNGKDIVKRVFNVISERLDPKIPKYILGFDNGWVLPQLEDQNNYMIILHTDFQKLAYRSSKSIIIDYSEQEKEDIIKDLRELIQLTQIEKTKLAIIIGWNVASVFRLAFIDYFNLFPHLYTFGSRYTGKSILGSFFTVHFFGIHAKHLSPLTLEFSSRLEDQLSTSTFPINIQEVHQVKNFNTLPILKDHATGISDFERKNQDGKRLNFKKPKIAGLNLDSNEVIKSFRDSAFNSKLITIEFKKLIKPSEEWKKLYRKLKGKKLFTFVYELTKEWKNETIFKQLEQIYFNIKDVFEIQEYDIKMPRLSSIYQTIRFGIDLFENVFGIELEKEELLNYLVNARRNLPSSLLDQFYGFCMIAKEFEEDTTEDYYDKEGTLHSKLIKGSNPKYLTHGLGRNKEKYIFTIINLRDFNEFIRRDYNLKELGDLLEDALEEYGEIKYGVVSLKGKSVRCIKIRKEYLD